MNGKTIWKPPPIVQVFLHFESGRWQSRQPEQYIQLEAINSDVPIVDIMIDPLIRRNILKRVWRLDWNTTPGHFLPGTHLTRFGLTNWSVLLILWINVPICHWFFSSAIPGHRWHPLDEGLIALNIDDDGIRRDLQAFATSAMRSVPLGWSGEVNQSDRWKFLRHGRLFSVGCDDHIIDMFTTHHSLIDMSCMTGFPSRSSITFSGSREEFNRAGMITVAIVQLSEWTKVFCKGRMIKTPNYLHITLFYHVLLK